MVPGESVELRQRPTSTRARGAKESAIAGHPTRRGRSVACSPGTVVVSTPPDGVRDGVPAVVGGQGDADGHESAPVVQGSTQTRSAVDRSTHDEGRTRGVAMEPLRVFIAYRREAGLLAASVVDSQIDNAFNSTGARRVEIFRDTRTRVGVAWPAEVREALSTADVVLVIIGPGWLLARDPAGRRRLDQPDDWVRLEIELALSSDKVVIPVAFGERVPTRKELPPSIGALADRQAAVVSDESHERDLQPVLGEIRRLLEDRSARALPAEGGKLPWPDPPMKFPPAAIPDDDLTLIVAEELPQWQVTHGPVRGVPDRVGVELHRELRFASFKDAIAFMSIVAEFADSANHHPRWENIFRTLSIYLSTWDIGHRVTSLDLMLASYIDKMYGQKMGAHLEKRGSSRR